MKRLDCAAFDSATLLDTCIGQLKSPADTNRFVAAKAALLDGYDAYAAMAGQRELYGAQSFLHGHDDQIICGQLTKGDLTSLYSKVMLDKDGAARKVYDQLLALPSLAICPYCGLGQVYTLDHFLAKARYPQFSVLCQNLVACCETCNKKMGGGVATADNIGVHPYFEEAAIEGVTWLTATLHESAPASATFHVGQVAAWSPELTKRVKNNFDQLELASRYAVAAANELASNAEILKLMRSAMEIRSHLEKTSVGLSNRAPNSWQAALHRALFASDWYVNGGYAAKSPGIGLAP
ncbi:MAG: hypothetical protein E6R08_00250 [Nevskiaceae bacterium]|nr:MAG: hypothetical protein E6R08_00250 [Nevskiaceae bacterium]